MLNFTGRINEFRVIERLERMNILGGQNTEGVNLIFLIYFYNYIFARQEFIREMEHTHGIVVVALAHFM